MMATRRLTAALALALLAGVLALDAVQGAPPDPFAAPPPFALGSGQAAGGAHCAAPPG